MIAGFLKRKGRKGFRKGTQRSIIKEPNYFAFFAKTFAPFALKRRPE